MQNARCFHQPDQTKALQPSAAERIAPGQARPGLQDKCAASESQLSLFSFIWQTSAPVIDDNLFVVHELRAAKWVLRLHIGVHFDFQFDTKSDQKLADNKAYAQCAKYIPPLKC